MKALSFIGDLHEISRVADFGCGTGAQTIELAQHIMGRITGVDLFPDFIDILNAKAKKMNLDERVAGIVGSMDNLSFQKEELDLIWSEGAIDNIGFDKGLRYWYEFLKKGGYVAVTCPSWLSDERPAEVEQFWMDAGSRLDAVEHNIAVMQKIGYSFVAAFALPDQCWMDNYFIPRGSVEKSLLKKYAGSKMVEDSIHHSQYEVKLYSTYKRFYGYVFYIGKKI